MRKKDSHDVRKAIVFWVGEILPDRFSSRRNERPTTTRRSCRNAYACGSKVRLVPIVTTHHVAGHHHELGLLQRILPITR